MVSPQGTITTTTMMERPPQDASQARSACTECQRRKQKCNREWPCNHCQKRKVADKCRFNNANQVAAEKAAQESRRKRRFDPDDHSDSSDDEIDGDGIDALGYMPSHVLYGLTAQDETVKTSSREYIRDAKNCPPLERALQVIPPRPYTDILVQNFLNNANYHYYIVYPPSFLEQYQKWWADRAENKPLGIQWTCLLLMVCASSTQYTDVELQRKLEVDLGDRIQKLTEQYHETARELSSSIPLGYSHLINVQQLLHSCYWFKSEARFVECWHVLNSCIREAQELSMHKESPDNPVSEFDLEIRRRVWCILDTWDWQISAFLGRPTIIDRADCKVGLPSLTLEGHQLSPLTYMKLQSALIGTLFSRFGLTKNVVDPADVQEYQRIIEEWIRDLPPTLDAHNPDTSLDKSCPWVVLHRHYIHTMAYCMLLTPIRVFLAQPFTIDATETEFKIRSDGIDYCLRLMVSLRAFFEHVYPRDSKLHFVLFCIFDTATVLCSAVLHDEHHNLPRRDDVYKAIDEAHDMLQRLKMVTKSAKASYGILSRIVQRLPRTDLVRRVPEASSAKRARVTEVAITPPAPVTLHTGHTPPEMVSPPDTLSPPQSVSSAHTVSPPHGYSPAPVLPQASVIPSAVAAVATDPLNVNGFGRVNGVNGYAEQTYVDWQQQPQPQQQVLPVTEQPYENVSFADVSEEDLTELAIWNYQSLDFIFDTTPGTQM